MSESKMSKVAVASIVSPVVLWGSGFLLLKLCGSLVGPIPEGWRSNITDLGILLLLVSMPVGLTVGVAALVWIRKNKGKLKGKRLAIEGIIVSIVLGLITILFFLIIRAGLNYQVDGTNDLVRFISIVS